MNPRIVLVDAEHPYDTRMMHSLDLALVGFLTALFRSAEGQDTVVVLKSDHGLQGGPYVADQVLQYEQKSPMLHILYPQARSADWSAAMQNSDKLVSAFDLHKTLANVIAGRTAASAVASNGPRWAYSLAAERIPASRTCEDAGIGIDYCACANAEQLYVHGKRANRWSPHRPLESVCNRYAAETLGAESANSCSGTKEYYYHGEQMMVSWELDGIMPPVPQVSARFAAEHRCQGCQAGGKDDGGAALVDGVCQEWCSSYGYCGYGADYRQGTRCGDNVTGNPS